MNFPSSLSRHFFFLNFAVAIFLVLFSSLPVSAQSGASSWVVVDVHSKRVLMAQNKDKKRSVDGFAGVATALVTIDWAVRTNTDVGGQVTIPMTIMTAGIANPMGLQPGDTISLRDLIYSVVLGADDAACVTLASVVGQDILSRRGKGGDPIVEFVTEMNYLAAMNSMKQTRFNSPHGGAWGRSGASVTTTSDLARLSIYAMNNSGFRFYSMQPDRAVALYRAGGVSRFKISNYNRFASKSSVDGVKVVIRGTSGPAAILTSKRSPEVTQLPDGRSLLYPRRVIAVVDGAADPGGMAWQLLSSGWQEFDRWSALGRPNDPATSLDRQTRF